MVSNNSDFSQEDDFNSEANGAMNEATNSFNKSEAFTYMKDFGKRGLQPLFGVVSKYRVDLNPYLTALDTGIKAAMSSLNQESSSEVDREVGKWFNQAAGFLSSAGEKLKSKNPTDLWHFFEEEARSQPGLMFSASYVAGLVLGRLGRHAGTQLSKTDSTVQSMTNQPATQVPPLTPEFPESSNIH